MPVPAILLLIVPLLVAWWITRYLVQPHARLALMDHPNERSLHVRPTPRSGGLAVLAAFFLVLPVILWWSGIPAGFYGMMGGMLLVAAVSFVDDVKNISPSSRFLVQAGAALLLLFGGFAARHISLPLVGELSLGWLAWPFSFLFVVWFINLYNFMDGMDGFAGGMSVSGFAFLALLGSGGHPAYSLLCLAIAGGALGFLWFNLPPARIFMGDTGAATLGYLAAAFSLWGVRDGLFPLWVPVLVFSAFVLDATFTLLRRAMNGDKLWQAHRSHYYQRLVQLGFGHKGTVRAEYLLMFLTGVSAFSYRWGDAVAASVIVGWGGIYLLCGWGVGWLEARRAD